MPKRAPLLTAMAALAAAAGLAAFFLLGTIFEKTPEVTVPAVVGMGLSEALDHLGAARLDLEVRGFEYSDQIPENLVLRQRPEPGRVVKASRGVRVVLSRGPERHQVPDLGGLTLEDATIQLEEAGFRVEVAARIHSGREGEILGQGVQPGAWLLKGRAVPLLVSAGRAPVLVRMPALEGLPLDKAVAEVESSQLKRGAIDQVPVEDPTKTGLVLRQTPAPGRPVPRGTYVALALATRPKDLPEPAGAEAPGTEETLPARQPPATPRPEPAKAKTEGGERP
jgi:serine/threonine-protein kinase